jgi:DNA-binding SARP family transcriptional activator
VFPPREESVYPSFTAISGAATSPSRIQLCGRFRVDIDGEHVTPALRGLQGRALLAYLVLNHNRPVSREELIDAIWPHSPPADPAAALRTQLSHLRRALGDETLAGRSAIELRLPRGMWIDVDASHYALHAAEAALASGDARDAWIQAQITLNIAERPFLAGFDAPWATTVRDELEEMELRARELIARAGIALGGSELAVAERSARAIIRTAPFRETGYVYLMDALAIAGRAAEALRVYDDLRLLLREEFGTAPGKEAQARHRRLLSQAAADKDAGTEQRQFPIGDDSAPTPGA